MKDEACGVLRPGAALVFATWLNCDMEDKKAGKAATSRRTP